MTGRPAGSNAAARARSSAAVQATGSGGGSSPSTAASCAILWPGRRRITARRRVGTIQAIVDPRMSTTRSHSVTPCRPTAAASAGGRALVEHDGTLAVRHAREHALGDRPAGDGDAGVRMGADQMVQQPGGQHRIAETVRRDEQDAHRVTGLAAGARLCEQTAARWPLQGLHGEAHDRPSRQRANSTNSRWEGLS